MATRTCERCGTEYSRAPSLLGRFCSPECGYKARTLGRTNVRRMVRAIGHPLSPRSGYVLASRLALWAKIGPGPHPCYWCHAPVNWAVGRPGNVKGNLIADHLNSDPLDDDPENLVPSCGRCNGGRARFIQESEDFIVRAGGRRVRVGQERSCRVCGEPFLTTVSLRTVCPRHRNHSPQDRATQ